MRLPSASGVRLPGAPLPSRASAGVYPCIVTCAARFNAGRRRCRSAEMYLDTGYTALLDPAGGGAA
ncbi:MAG: hypothetical protein LBI02_01670 [Opitutaceae bacterium]|nr:hypothetical protein [Opitutaceae bacterium]